MKILKLLFVLFAFGQLDAMHQKGIDAETKAEQKLFDAVMAGNKTLVDALLESGANINAWDKLGRTPLFVAIINKDYPIANLLIDKGAYPNIKYMGDTLLTTALKDLKPSNDRLELVKKLLSHGAEVNATDEFGQTALLLAADQGDTHIIKELLSHGADMFLANKRNATAWTAAKVKGYKDIIDLLDVELVNRMITDPEFLNRITTGSHRQKESQQEKQPFVPTEEKEKEEQETNMNTLRRRKPEIVPIPEKNKAPTGKLKYY